MSQATSPYKVRLIVDRDFGERLSELPHEEPVWVVDSAVNTPVAHRLWRSERSGESSLAGITTFKDSSDSAPEDIAIGVLEMVDLHHGQYSADPPFSVLEIIGCEVSDRLREALAEFDFIPQAPSGQSIIAVRPK